MESLLICSEHELSNKAKASLIDETLNEDIMFFIYRAGVEPILISLPPLIGLLYGW
jgi:hypothetical protein